MLITRTSPLTGKDNTMDLPITEEQWAEWNSPNRRVIQKVFPNLHPDQREFLLTGYTPEDWNEMFPIKEEDAA